MMWNDGFLLTAVPISGRCKVIRVQQLNTWNHGPCWMFRPRGPLPHGIPKLPFRGQHPRFSDPSFHIARSRSHDIPLCDIHIYIHYITLHYIYITLHYITLTLHYITLITCICICIYIYTCYYICICVHMTIPFYPQCQYMLYTGGFQTGNPQAGLWGPAAGEPRCSSVAASRTPGATSTASVKRRRCVAAGWSENHQVIPG
jgi:hypothetical protein